MGSLEPKVCVPQVIGEARDEALDSDETSSTPHFSALCSQEDEGGNDTTLVSQENVIKFLDDTFRKRHVKIKDYFPNLHNFIQTARSMIREPYQVNMSDPQFQRLRKCVTRAGKELQE